MLRAPLHECANRSWSCVEDCDTAARTDVPEAILCGRIGSALVHHAGSAVGERAIDEVGVAGHPADVGGAPEDVVVAEIEDELRRRRCSGQVAAGGVRSEERRVGKECRSRWGWEREKKKGVIA